MTTMNVSLPTAMKSFVDEQVKLRGYQSSSEYIRDLLRREQDHERLRSLLTEGLASGPGRILDDAYIDELRKSVRRRAVASTAAQAVQGATKRGPKASAR